MLVTSYSRKFHKKGGVAIYVQENIGNIVEAVNVTNFCQELTCELAMVKISLKKCHLFVTGVYRPPGGNIEEALQTISEVFEETKADNYSVVVVGDINIDHLKEDVKSKMLDNTLSSHNMRRLPLPATRVTATTSTSIDCVCTNLQVNDIHASVIETGISDHKGQICTLKIAFQQEKNQSAFRRNLNQDNLDLLNTLLEEEKWEDMYGAATAEDSYNKFIETITQKMNTACPKKKIRAQKKQKGNFFADAEAQVLKKDYLNYLRRFEQFGRNDDKANAARLKKQYDLRLRQLRQQSSINHVNNAENKSKALWQIINREKKGKRIEQPQLKLKIGDKIVSNPNEVVNHMNSYFATIADKTLENTQNISGQQVQYEHPIHSLTNLLPTDDIEMENIIRSLKPKTSAGIDDISAKLLKHCCNPLVSPLVHITNKSIAQGQFPSAMKLAKVYPNYKKGSEMDISNYRPISLIPTFSKVMERVVLKRLMDYCRQHSLLTDSQHGFLKGRSTTSAIIQLAEFIIDNLDTGNLVTTVLLDFSKAFDCLGHDLILNKLQNLGIQGTALAWFHSYLKGRKQVVEIKSKQNGKIEDIRSEPLPMNRGVPQGSVLGPVLFILFTNDLPQYLDACCKTLMYADDTTLLLSGKNAEQLSIDSYVALNMAYQYCHSNDLAVNPSKTNQLTYGRRKEEISTIPEVEQSEHTKFLGLMIDNDVSWNQHVDTVINKLNSALFVIKRIIHISDPHTAKVAYHALFECHINYGLAAWGGTTATNLQKVLVLQKRAIRTLAGLSFRDSCRGAFTSLKILTVIALYIKEVVLFVDREQTQRSAALHRHNTRHAASTYLLPAHHLSLYQRKPTYMGRKLHNTLPEDIRCLTGKQLKTALTNWLMRTPFYSLEEFLHWREQE